jgi:hypothetical protein
MAFAPIEVLYSPGAQERAGLGYIVLSGLTYVTLEVRSLKHLLSEKHSFKRTINGNISDKLRLSKYKTSLASLVETTKDSSLPISRVYGYLLKRRITREINLLFNSSTELTHQEPQCIDGVLLRQSFGI